MKNPKNLRFTLLVFLCFFINQYAHSQTYSATDSVMVPFTDSYTNSTRGFRFSPDTTILVRQLGKMIPNALGNYTWTIWDVDNTTIVHQQTSTANTGGVYTYEPISIPIILAKGGNYAIALHCDGTPGAQFYYGFNSQVNTYLTYNAVIMCNNCPANVYPNQSFVGFHMGLPDFHFCIPSTGVDTQVACDSFTWIDGNTYTSSNNTATYSIQGGAANGCDSIVTLNLTINNSSTGTDTQVACDSYTWIDGNTYTSSNNTAMHTLTNSMGCDSVVTLNLTINSSSTGTDTQVACDSYTWIDGNTYTSSNNTATHTLTNSLGCDSVVTLNLTINNSSTSTDTQVACDSYIWIDGNTYTSSNNSATHTLTNGMGCDSIVTLNLTINSSSSGTDTQIACDSYTWIDGNTYTSSNNSATYTLTNSMGCDSVVTLNLTINSSSSGIDTQIACDSYTWIDGNTYTASNNTATHTLTNSLGCDSIVTLNLTINNSSTATDTQVACDAYTWIDGNTYTASNSTATHTLTNSLGCDSIVTLNLTINNSSTGIDSQTACNSYTWIDGNTYTSSNNTATHILTNSLGCDSIVTLNLTILTAVNHTQSITICAGETYTIGTDSYHSSGTYTTILTTHNGCDSIVTTHLAVAQEIDTYVERLNADFSVKPIPNATYQWLNCNDNYAPITGATNASYTATEIGSYAVSITSGLCTDTSICNYLPYIVSIEEEEKKRLNIYPNPTQGDITIEYNYNLEEANISILDITGKIVFSTPTQDNSNTIQLSTVHFKDGIYIVQLKADDLIETLQFIKH